ncbi:MAG TPA: PfkB family carbohydrate kinase, partial [Bacteroidota bacterium]|nr:PfkB family carbohydrate kinase [Bacteroidota bacterium]
MSVLVVGSLALDSIETPFGAVQDTVGGSATYIAAAASYFASPVRVVGIVGGDFPQRGLSFLEERHVDLEGLEVVAGGKTFRWAGRYHYDLNERDTLLTELNVFERFDPKIPEKYRRSRVVCLGNIDPVLQRRVLDQIEKPRFVVCDTMNYWIEKKNGELRETLKSINALILNDSEARLLSHEPNLIKAGRVIRAMGPGVVIIKKGEHGALEVFFGHVV